MRSVKTDFQLQDSRFDSRDYEDYCHLRCDIVQVGRHILAFLRNLQGRRVREGDGETIFSETPIKIYQVTCCHIPEYSVLYSEQT
jgi:hypothetical protein